MLVATGSRVRRRRRNVVVGVSPASRWLLSRPWGRRVHHGQSIPGPPTTDMHWLDRTPTQRPCWARLIFVGDVDEAPDSGSPLVEPLRGRRKVEEQLHARQRFCWRGWRRKLRGPRRALTSNHVRRSPATVSRMRAVSASVWARMLARCISRVTQRALPAAAPGGTDVTAFLVMRDLRRPRCGHRLGRPGGCRAARGQHGPPLDPAACDLSSWA